MVVKFFVSLIEKPACACAASFYLQDVCKFIMAQQTTLIEHFYSVPGNENNKDVCSKVGE